MVDFASDPHRPPVRVMALHALEYCERLFYLEEVEEIRVANTQVYAGRALHSALEDLEDAETWTLEHASEALGVAGKMDAVRRRDGSLYPYEHKRGRPVKDENGEPQAWESDRIQAIAYAALLAEATGEEVVEARIRYHAANATVRVPIDGQALADLRAAVARARELRESTDRPPVTDNERLCVKCSLAPVCLPEEVRTAEHPEREPRRLFPPDRDGTTLHVLTPGTRVGRRGESLILKHADGTTTSKGAAAVEAVALHGYAQISTQALGLCAWKGIAVHWLTAGGRHTGSFTSTAGQVQRRVRQYRVLAAEAFCLDLARRLVTAKASGQHAYLLRASRGKDGSRESLDQSLKGLRAALRHLGRPQSDADSRDADSRDAIRGYEGAAAVHYFAGLRRLVGANVPEELRSASRSRRPPLDRFNALLGYGYGMLHAAVMRAVLVSGLEPALGFFHTPRSAAYPLVLDLMELFRVPLWDVVMLGSLNRGQWDPDADFVLTRAKVWLSEDGRRKAIGLFEDRLQETWKHPVLGYSLSYGRAIELEARLLEKEWTGEPGLFARSRLR